MWYWKTDTQQAEVKLVNDMYRWRIFTTWQGPYSKVRGPMVAEGQAGTLSKAKHAALAALAGKDK